MAFGAFFATFGPPTPSSDHAGALLRYRLLALDADGTILDSSGVLRPAVREAVASVRARGVRVVLCTGRRYRTAAPVLEALELDGPAVVQNGVVVKDGATGQTLHARYVPRQAYRAAVRLLCSLGPPAVYVDEEPDSRVDLFAEHGDAHHPFLSEYLEANAEQVGWVDSLESPPSGAVTMISAMAGLSALYALQERVADSGIRGIRTNLIANKNYRGHILEIVREATGKWQRLREIARDEGIDEGEIVAIGDDTNDLEMIQGAGLGIAMSNANEAVRAAADYVTASNDEDGAVRAIRTFFS